MARFNISYVITAIDKFSGVAEKLKDQLAGVRGAMSRTAEKVSLEADKIDNKLRAMGGRLNTPMHARSIDFSPAKNSIDRFNDWAGKYAFKGFINSMSIIMPMMMVFGKPFKDLMAQQKALASLSQSKLNVGQLRSQAEGLAKVSTFSVSDILSSQAILAAKDANQKNIQQIMKVAIDVAAKNNESLSQAVQQINTAIFARGKVSTVGGLVVKGLTEQQRISSLMQQSKSIAGSAALQAQTTTGRLQQSMNNLNEALSKFLDAAAPAFLTLSKAVNAASNAISNFVSKHKTLVKIITDATIAVIALVAAQVLLGAVMSGVGMVLKLFSTGFKLLRFSIVGAKLATKAFAVVYRELPMVFGIVEYWLKKIVFDYALYGIRLVAAKVKTVALGAATLAWKGILLALRGAMLVLNTALVAFDALMAANPIGLVIIAVTALIAGIYELVKHWKKVKTVFFEVCTAVSGFVDTYILKPIENIWHYIMKYIDPAIQKVTDLAKGVSSIVGGTIHTVMHPIDTATSVAKSVYSAVAHPLQTLSGGAYNNQNVNSFFAQNQAAMAMLPSAPLNVHHTTHVHLYNSNSATAPSATYTAHNNQSLHANVGTTHLEHHQIIRRGGLTFDFQTG